MRFTVSSEAIERLGLSTELKELVFDGPPINKGLIAHLTVAEQRWARRELLHAGTTQDADAAELALAYFVLVIRRVDPHLLPPAKFASLAAADFEPVPHAHVGERVICRECGQPLDDDVHDVPDDQPL